MKRLPDAELDVMKALWSLGPKTGRSAVEARLQEHGWAVNTINTYLTRLTEKGFLKAEKQGRQNVYTPLVSKEEYLAFDSRATLKRLYGGSPTGFVAALARDGLKREEIDDLRALLDQLDGGPGHG